MSITEAIDLLKAYNGPLGLTLHGGASEELISKAEFAYGITLPHDFKAFYRFTDGFETNDYMFNVIPLKEMIDNKISYKNDPLYIAEYMIYSDMWELEINPDDNNDYKIIVNANDNKLVLTNSLAEFIDRILKGGLHDTGGLNDWAEEVEAQPIYSTKVKTAALLLTLFYYGLRYGIIAKKEITDWADQLVMHENEPDSFFMELSLCSDKNELISHLNSVRVPENSDLARAILGLLYHRLSDGAIKADEAITVMNKPIFSDMLTAFEHEQIYNFTDEIWMDDPMIEDEALTADLLDFLAYYKEFEINNYKYWLGISARIEYKIKSQNEPVSEPVAPTKINRKKIDVPVTAVLVVACILLDGVLIHDIATGTDDHHGIFNAVGPVLTFQTGRAIYKVRKGMRGR